MNRLTLTAQPHPRRHILYWIAVSKLTGREVDRNNSIAILRSRTDGVTCMYKGIR